MTSKRVNFHSSAFRDIAFCDETFQMITEETRFINNSKLRNMIFARLKLQKKAQNPPGKLDNITVHRNAELVVDAPIMAHVLTLKY